MNHHTVSNDKDVRESIIALGEKLNIPVVATFDSHYPHTEDAKAHETLLAIQTNTDVNDENKFSFGDDDYSFVTPEKAYEMFTDIPEAVENTVMVANLCNVEIDLGKWVFPNFIVPDGKSNDEKLR